MMRAGVGTVEKASGMVWAAQVFLFSLMMPFAISLGPLFLMPHRLVLLIMFIPSVVMLYGQKRAGPVLWPDWLMLGAAFWSALALVANHGISSMVEPIGIHILEFLGAYVLARVTVRSAADFRKIVGTVFVMLLILLPFAIAESLLKRPVMLDLIPGTAIVPVDTGLRMGLRRAQAVFAHPILYGVFVSTLLGLFWYGMRPRSLGYIAASLAMVATFFSLSTGALISVVVQTTFITWDAVMKSVKHRWRIFILLFVATYIAIDLLSNRTPFHVLVTYGSLYQGSAYGRIVIWQYGTENVWANPIFGLGMREWARPGWLGPSVDNFWLFMTMRFGLPFMAMMAGGLLMILRWVSIARLTNPDDQLARAAYLTAFGGLVVAGGTVHFWHAMLAFAMFIFASGVWTITGGSIDDDDREDEPVPEPRRSRYSRQAASGTPISGGVRQRPPLRATTSRRRQG